MALSAKHKIVKLRLKEAIKLLRRAFPTDFPELETWRFIKRIDDAMFQIEKAKEEY